MLSEELIILNRGSVIAGTICLRKCVGIGSSIQVDEFAEEMSEISSFSSRGVKNSRFQSDIVRLTSASITLFGFKASI